MFNPSWSVFLVGTFFCDDFGVLLPHSHHTRSCEVHISLYYQVTVKVNTSTLIPDTAVCRDEESARTRGMLGAVGYATKNGPINTE